MKAIRVVSVLFLLFLTLLLIRGSVLSKTGPSTEDVSVVPLEGNPHAVAINPFSGIAVVASIKPDEVSIVDLAARTVIKTIPGGKAPLAVAIDSNLNYGLVTSRHNDTLSVIDLNTYRVIATIPVGRSPEGIAVSQPNGIFNIVLVANNQDDSVDLFINMGVVIYDKTDRLDFIR